MMSEERVVVITGGTSGIGAATAKAFAKLGSKVIITGRNYKAGLEISEEAFILNGSIEFVQCDVTNIDSIEKLRETINQKYGRVDVLFNNAGMMPTSKEIEKITKEEWLQTFDVNLNGVFYVTRALKEALFRSKGCIINNTSIAGMQSYIAGRSYAYSASKSALIQLTRQMAKNYAEEGIRVNAIAPGIIETKILGDRDRKDYTKRIPLGYIAEPYEVAEVVVFLASEGAKYITGAVIPVDGGVSL